MLPNFLCIGAQRSGTTWLHRVLSEHPNVFLPARKELHFFDREILHQDLAGYERNFAPSKSQHCVGEITPAYMSLPPSLIATVKCVLPDARLVLIIRNPVDRVLSYLRTFPLHTKPNASLGYLLRNHVDRLSKTLQSDYEPAIRNWRMQYGKDALQIQLYDRILTDPVGLIAEVLQHIGADMSWRPPADVVQRRVSIRNGQRADLINHIDFLQWYLKEKWRDPIMRLNDALDGQVTPWIRDLDQGCDASWTWRTYAATHRYFLFPWWDAMYRVHDSLRGRMLTSAARRLQVAQIR